MEQLQSEMEPTPLNILKIQTTQWIIHMVRIILWFSKLTRWTSLKLRKLIWKIKLVEFKNEIIFVKFVEIVLHLNRNFLTILMPVRANESGNISIKLKFWVNFDNYLFPTCFLNWSTWSLGHVRVTNLQNHMKVCHFYVCNVRYRPVLLVHFSGFILLFLFS